MTMTTFRMPEDTSTAGRHSEQIDEVLAGTPLRSPGIDDVARSTAELADVPVVGELAASAGVVDDVVALARLRHVIDAEISRRVYAADNADAWSTTARSTLQDRAHWSGSAADAMAVAARFVPDHPDLMSLWQRGRVSLDAVAAIARATRGLPHREVGQLVNALLPSLPTLSMRHLRIALARAVDLLRPEDGAEREQRDYDSRYLVFSDCHGNTLLQGQLPGVDGAALQAALTALAESLRVEGDSLTKGQRQADALMALVNRAAAHGDLPATTSGLPVAATITVGISEADRIASWSRRAGVSLRDAAAAGQRPAGLGEAPTSSATLGDAAVRFALCSGTWTGVIVDDRAHLAGPIAAALATTATAPLAVGRRTRLATPAQRTALALRDGGCVICNRPPAECQTHHVVPWSAGGSTDLENLALLCWAHHRAVDLNRWTLTRRDRGSPGRYWSVTPTPRHLWRSRIA